MGRCSVRKLTRPTKTVVCTPSWRPRRHEVVTLTTERDTALAALFAAGVEKAILEANAAMQTYARLLVTYEGIDANAATARGLVTAANRAKTEADEALAEAQAGDDVVLTTRAQRAVDQADAAVLTANAQLAEATTTAAAMPYAMAIMAQADGPASLDASAKRTGNEVTVTVTGGDPVTTVIAKGSASDAGHGWYKADVANEEDSSETATVLYEHRKYDDEVQCGSSALIGLMSH